MRGLRLSSAIVAGGLVVGGIAISLPTAASSAASRAPATAVTHLAKHYTLNQLLSGVLFDVGPVGQLIEGTQTSLKLTTNETKALKAFVSALGAAKGQQVATGLQSGNVVQFAQAVNAIDDNVGALSNAAVSGGHGVAAARAALARSGDLGTACSRGSGTDAATCAQSPANVGPNAGKITAIAVSVAIYRTRTSIAVLDSTSFFIGSSSANLTAGSPNSVAIQKEEMFLVNLLHA